MYGLLDCNNFFVSCERVFNPSLNGKPVVVMSNNDGCIIARSNEAKALGIKMGTPYFEARPLIERCDVKVFSSNYVLYGDMSRRVMEIVSSMTPETEVYSIDELFISFEGVRNIPALAAEVVRKVIKGTGIPVSLGIAPTKTLAKIGSKFAKKYPAYNHVCLIDSEEKRIKALQLTEVGDVWGVGRRTVVKLEKMGVSTAYDFTQLSQSWVRKYSTVVGERTWRELKGESCIDLETVEYPKKMICTSRSFAKQTDNYEDLRSAIAANASACAVKLRQQHTYAKAVTAFILTNAQRMDTEHYSRYFEVVLPVASDDTMEIVKYALAALQSIYKKGYWFKKSGVIITRIENVQQMGVFDDISKREKRKKISAVMDKVNLHSRNKLRLAVQESNERIGLRRDQLSKLYTTDLKQLIEIR